MTRTLTLRTHQESLEYWTLDKEARIPTIVMCQGAVKEELQRTIAARSYAVNTYNLQQLANKQWLSKSNGWMDSIQLDSISYVLSSLLRKGGENAVFPLFVLNEFLLETDPALVYGDFLETNWDRLVGITTQCQVAESPHALEIFSLRLNYDSLLFVRPNARKSTVRAILALTLAEVKALYELRTTGQLSAKPSAIPQRIKALLNQLNGVEDRLPTKESILIDINAAFVKLYGRETESSLQLFSKGMELFTKQSNNLYKRLFDDPTQTNAGLQSTADIAPIMSFLRTHAERFRFWEFILLVHSLYNPAVIISSSPGRVTKSSLLYSRVIQLPTDDAIASLKVLAELMLIYTQDFPTLDEWIVGVDDMTVARSLSSEIAIALIAGSSDRVRVSPDLQELRRALRPFNNS